MLSSYLQVILNLPVRNNQNRPVLWKIVRLFQTIHARLQYGSSSSRDFYPAGNIFRCQISRIRRFGIAENDSHERNIFRRGIAGDGAECHTDLFCTHGTGCVHDHTEGPALQILLVIRISWPWNIRRGTLPSARPRIGAVFFQRWKLYVKPLRQRGIPGNGRHRKRPDFLYQPGRQETTIVLLMVIQSLPQCVFQQFIQAAPVFSSSKMRSVSVKHITSAKAPEGV